ncbi:MAG TPA: hypothetical protein VEZ41_03895 [Allosphingosinicella sp.]|nr:hypothetical protein [Allosphingosinicella sp.]
MTLEDGGANSLGQAQQLHGEAKAARARGQHALAAAKFEEAYEALPDACTPVGMGLVVEADRAYHQAYKAQSDGVQLCKNERMLAAALGDGSCSANSGEIGERLRERRQQMRRDRVVCPTAMPALRWPDESLPLGARARIGASGDRGAGGAVGDERAADGRGALAAAGHPVARARPRGL